LPRRFNERCTLALLRNMWQYALRLRTQHSISMQIDARFLYNRTFSLRCMFLENHGHLSEPCTSCHCTHFPVIIGVSIRDVRNRFLKISIRLLFGFLKKSHSVQNEFCSVRFKKRGSVRILYLLLV